MTNLITIAATSLIACWLSLTTPDSNQDSNTNDTADSTHIIIDDTTTL